jgi:hypothetical protein
MGEQGTFSAENLNILSIGELRMRDSRGADHEIDCCRWFVWADGKF